MRMNEGELTSALALCTPEWEGRLTYKAPGRAGGFRGRGGDEYKERWFRLKSNFLFYWRITSGSLGGRPPPNTEPMGALLLENSHVQQEGFAEAVHAFSIIFAEEPDKKHMFLAQTRRGVEQWITALRGVGYEALREKLITLQIELMSRTGIDPLVGTNFEGNPVYCPKPGSTTSSSSLFDTGLLADVGQPVPKPKPRKSRALVKSTFQSHVVENWESHSPTADRKDLHLPPLGEKKPSFHSHLKGAFEDQTEKP